MPSYTFTDPKSGKTLDITGPTPPSEAVLRQMFAQLPADSGPKGLLEKGNVDLFAQPEVQNPDGGKSTVFSTSFNMDGKEYLLPAVTPDGRFLKNDQEILAEFDKTGRHLGVFDNADDATAYGKQLHLDYAAGKYKKPEPEPTFLDTAKNVAAGFAKGAGRTVKFLADDVPHAFGGAGVSDYVDMATGQPEGSAYKRVSEGLTNQGTAQTVGGAIESAAELAIPFSKAAEAVPTTAKAGAKFQEVMGAARNVPVDISAPGQVALRINELAERGGSMPKAVRNFLTRVTDPNKPQIAYEEARDFASNISRLSANEMQRLTPVVAREVAQLRVTLNRAVADAASKVGKGQQYAEAMNEYAKAKRLTDAIDLMIAGAKKGLPYGIAGGAAGAGYWMTSKIRDLLPGD